MVSSGFNFFIEYTNVVQKAMETLTIDVLIKVFILRKLFTLYRLVKNAFRKCVLLYEYKDLFIDMDVRKNRFELAIANRHQER